MAEIEIHHGHGHDDDPLAKRVGLMVGIIGVLLAVVTIASHREHTAAVLYRTEANDQWAFYQAKKIREHVSDVGRDLALAVGTDAARVDATVKKLDAARAKYVADAEGIKAEAERAQQKTEHTERLALRFDLGEGFLELGLVLTSLYFLGRQRVFPLGGGLAAVVGLAVALSALAL